MDEDLAKEFMERLDEVYDVSGYGLLMRKGDPIAFEIGLREFEREIKHEPCDEV